MMGTSSPSSFRHITLRPSSSDLYRRFVSLVGNKLRGANQLDPGDPLDGAVAAKAPVTPNASNSVVATLEKVAVVYKTQV